MEINLPEGEILAMNFAQIKSGGPTAIEGEKYRRFIVGRTGKYSGIKGTYGFQIRTN